MQVEAFPKDGPLRRGQQIHHAGVDAQHGPGRGARVGPGDLLAHLDVPMPFSLHQAEGQGLDTGHLIRVAVAPNRQGDALPAFQGGNAKPILGPRVGGGVRGRPNGGHLVDLHGQVLETRRTKTMQIRTKVPPQHLAATRRNLRNLGLGWGDCQEGLLLGQGHGPQVQAVEPKELMPEIRLGGVASGAHDQPGDPALEVRFPGFQLPFHGDGHALLHAGHQGGGAKHGRRSHGGRQGGRGALTPQKLRPAMLAHQWQQTLPFVLHGVQLHQLARVAVRIHLVQVAPSVRGNGRRRFLGHVVRLTAHREKHKTLC